jgi:hypothetical protein
MAEERLFPSHRNNGNSSKVSIQTFGLGKSLLNPFETTPSVREKADQKGKLK